MQQEAGLEMRESYDIQISHSTCTIINMHNNEYSLYINGMCLIRRRIVYRLGWMNNLCLLSGWEKIIISVLHKGERFFTRILYAKKTVKNIKSAEKKRVFKTIDRLLLSPVLYKKILLLFFAVKSFSWDV
ncbi:hypothetical protein BM1374166_01824 [Bartonella tribocorum]|nr:hypothetical protein BM1374166_01824 [Bartonella tribocorum]